MGDQHEKETSSQPSEKGGLRKFIKTAGQKSAAATGAVAGSALAGLGSVAGAATRQARLLRAPAIDPHQIPAKSISELAKAFADWLQGENEGLVELETVSSQPDNEQILVKLKEKERSSKISLFLFASAVTEELSTLLLKSDQQPPVEESVALGLDWAVGRFKLEKELSLFVWKDGMRLGKDNSASSLLSLWLIDYTAGFQFEKKELIEEPDKAKSSSPRRQTSYFIGREEPLRILSRSILSTRLVQDHLSWLFSIWGEGGVGKSALLQKVQQECSPQMLYAQVDHQNPEDSEEGLVRLMRQLAEQFQLQGCPTPRFDKVNTQLLVAERQQTAGGNASGGGALELARNVGGLLSEDRAKNLVSTLTKNFAKVRFLKYLPGALNLTGMAFDVGFNVYDRISEELKTRNEAILSSRPIQELTEGLVEDLAKFVEEQRKKYYLWRRPVLAFDTYELIGPLADKWLRTVLLKNQQFEQLDPVLIVSGRYELPFFDSRWSEYEAALRIIKLEEFNEAEATSYLEKLDIHEPERVQELYQWTGGLPLFLSRAASLSSEEKAVKVLSDRILEEVEPEFREAFLDMAIPDGFNFDTVRRVLGSEDEEQAKAVLERLCQASFVEERGGKLHFLPTVRHVFLRYDELKRPERVAEVRGRLG